jgi:hypothetical protein
MHEAHDPVTRRHMTALLLTIVQQLRLIRAAEGCLTFTETVARSVSDRYGLLSEIATTLDTATAEEVDEELAKLWTAAMAPA